MLSRQFVAGLIVGMGVALVIPAVAARLVGDNGYLVGWEITVGGTTVCTDPYIWTATREIECD